MPYVNMTEMLFRAQREHYAVAQFNLNNLECIRVFLQAAEKTHSPLIIGVSGNIAKSLGGYRTIAAVTKGMIEAFDITIPVCLHADHCTLEQALSALESGFSSVMYDGSHETFPENLRNTRLLAKNCHIKQVTLEAEVGAVAGEEDGVSSRGECADPDQCAQIAACGIDLLAAGIGNVHGKYPADWQGLDFVVLEKIRQACPAVPLVLHGGSGIPEEMIRRAIAGGICKINVNTECRIAFDEATRRFITEGCPDKNYTGLITMQPGLEAVGQVCIEKLRLFGCLGRA